MGKVFQLQVIQGEGKKSEACDLEAECPIKQILTLYPDIRFSSTYFAGSADDGRRIDGHSKIKDADIDNLRILLHRMSLKLNNLYNARQR